MSVRQSLILPPMGPHLRWVLSTFLSENKIQDNKRNTKMMTRMKLMMVLVMKMTMMIRRRRMTIMVMVMMMVVVHSTFCQKTRSETTNILLRTRHCTFLSFLFSFSFLFVFFSFSFLFFIFTLFILTFIQIRFKNTKFSPHTLISPIALDFIFELSFRIGERE